jgi:hypothetical protein
LLKDYWCNSPHHARNAAEAEVPATTLLVVRRHALRIVVPQTS